MAVLLQSSVAPPLHPASEAAGHERARTNASKPLRCRHQLCASLCEGPDLAMAGPNLGASWSYNHDTKCFKHIFVCSSGAGDGIRAGV